MNILYLLDSGNPGGMERHVLDLVEGMGAAGNEVFVWCRTGDIVRLYEKAGATVIVKKISFDIDPVYIWELVNFLKKEKIDIVHAHELRAVGNAMFATRFVHTKLITNIHTPFSQWRIPKFKKYMYTYLYSIATRFCTDTEIAVSQSTKLVKMTEGVGVPDNKIKVILNGIHDNEFNISEDKKHKYASEIKSRHLLEGKSFIFGNLSRISDEKGHHVLLDAFRKFLEYKSVNREEIALLIAGGGPLEDEIRQKITNQKIDDLVIVTGRFAEEDKVKYYATFDCFVFPTLAEGYGMVLAEAQAMGLPVICSDLEVLKEVGGSAVFAYFETANSTDLAEKMYNLYLKKDNLAKTAENSIERVRQLYSMDKFIDEYINLYTELLEDY